MKRVFQILFLLLSVSTGIISSVQGKNKTTVFVLITFGEICPMTVSTPGNSEKTPYAK